MNVVLLAPWESMVWMVLMVDKDDQEIKYVAMTAMFLVTLALFSLLCRAL